MLDENNIDKAVDKLVDDIMIECESIFETFRKNCENDMKLRINLNRRTNDNNPQRPLTPKYLKSRKKPSLPILVQTGSLRDSIKVSFNQVSKRGDNSFLSADGSDLARQHNKGYTYTMRNGVKNEVDPRICLEIPKEYEFDGINDKFMIEDISKVAVKEIKNFINKNLKIKY
tara:strand:+ start:122 stop:637 length:516 start_codon:yes stop_codon:yes gene_type:complete